MVPVPAGKRGKASSASDAFEWTGPAAQIGPIVEGCDWIRHAHDDAADLPEPEWYAMLGITGRCEDGEKLAHDWSAPHSKYNVEETDRKLRHALAAGPRTCENLAAIGADDYCFNCPNRDRIKSPIVLGCPKGSSPSPERGQVDVPPYPVDVLPEPARSLAKEGAAALGVPPDLIAVHLVALAAAVLGRKVSLVVKDGWEELPTLWSAVVAAPGSAKSPALNMARLGIDALQRAAVETYNCELAAYAEELALSKEGKGDGKREAPLPKPEPPELQSYFSSDATPEALGPMLKHSPGMAIIHDELAGFVKGMDRYKGGKGNERQYYLGLWAGHISKIDRAGKPSVVIERPVTCVLGGIQPDLLREFSGELVRADGLLDRFLWSVPVCGALRWTDAGLSGVTRRRIEGLFEQLSTLTGELSFGPDSKRQYVAWHNMNSNRVDSEQGLMKGVCSKLPAQLARLTLVLHCLANPTGGAWVASAETMSNAIDLVEYHCAHARKALASLGGPDRGDGSLIARVAAALGVSSVSSQPHFPGTITSGSDIGSDWLTLSFLHKKLGNRTAATDLEAALNFLVDRGVIEHRTLQPQGPRGGRPSEQYRGVTQHEETEETPHKPISAGSNTADSTEAA